MIFKIDVDHATRTLESIRNHGAEHFGMFDWYKTYDPVSDDRSSLELHYSNRVNINDCGTTACLAGHAALCMLRDGIQNPCYRDVGNWLGIMEPEQCQADGFPYLFRYQSWGLLGDHGGAAVVMARCQGKWKAAIYLLESLIADQMNAVREEEQS